MLLAVFSILIILVITGLLAKYVGIYMYHSFRYEATTMDKLFLPIENIIYKVGGIKTSKHQNWKQYILALLATNTLMIILLYLIFRLQGHLPLNFKNFSGVEPSLAIHTAVSFMTNTNQQHYIGETTLSNLSTMLGLIFGMFAAPATAIAVTIAFIRGLAGKKIGNFFVDFTRAITRVLLPISIIVAIIFVSLGMPQTLERTVSADTIEGINQTINVGPFASYLTIKQLGNNGGGIVGSNASVPFSNPNGYTNLIHILLMLLLPMAFPFTFGKIVGSKKEGRILFVAMLMVFIVITGTSLFAEYQGNPVLNKLGIQHQQGSMEGKEVRFGPGLSAFYAATTAGTQTGAVNNMHDTLTPMAGFAAFGAMMLNAAFGGVGVGFMNVLMYVIISVFIAGLMVGRTPEYLGKKVEGKEMKLIAVTLLIFPLILLGGTALGTYLPAGYQQVSNPGFHGFSQMLYEFTSAAANNGSGFEGLGDNNTFWNIANAIVIFLGRYFPMVTLMAVAGSLLKKQKRPVTSGTFHTDTVLFGAILIGIIVIVGALTFFPSLVLGPIAEQLILP